MIVVELHKIHYFYNKRLPEFYNSILFAQEQNVSYGNRNSPKIALKLPQYKIVNGTHIIYIEAVPRYSFPITHHRLLYPALALAKKINAS